MPTDAGAATASSAHRLDVAPLHLEFVLTDELVAVGELVSSMKRVVGVLGSTFNSLDQQTERVATLAPALKANEELKKLRAQFERQLGEQRLRALAIRQLLDDAVKQTLTAQFKEYIAAALKPQIKDIVAEQLMLQIPDHLRQKIKSHKRQILEVQCSLHNSAARQYNAGLGPDSLTDPLRPLLRPLPSAEQSPMLTTSPAKPALVPDTLEEPTPSPLFPTTLQSLFALKSEEAETLVKEYGLEDQPVPVTPLEESTHGHERNLNINKFMAHIGVSRCWVRNARAAVPRLHIEIPGERLCVTTYY
ncbi:hypothetical protein MKEN_00677100 [Mycena kentingensis (nom. inval.)]|nr:hypothetical protein MKEN_00677100 [Mycena kentingensis (nom. inval.)]